MKGKFTTSSDLRAGLLPLFSSSLTLATVIAVVLNQALRIRPAAAPAAASH